MRKLQIILNAILAKDRFEYILIDRDFKVSEYSSGAKKYLSEEIKEGEDIFITLPELVGLEEEIHKIFANKTFTYELESVHKNDYYLNICAEHFDDELVLILLHNITDRTISQQKLLQYSNESILLNNTLQKILDSQNALLFVTNNNQISYTNEQFLEYFGLKRIEELRRRNLQIYKYFDEDIQSYDELFEKVNCKEEYIVIGQDTFILQATWIEATHKLFTLTKVTKLTHEIQVDSLTGAYKKSYFNSKLRKIIQHNENAVLVVVDIDNFKMINDTYGHQTGDEVLREFATLIQQNIRSDDVFARWGGEEFLLLLQHTTLENAMRKVESLRVLVAEHSFKDIGHMTASFGVAWKEESDDLHSILQRADKALYEAKKAGKNCVVFKSLN